MEREIIFRGKCTVSKKWIYGSLIVLNWATESEPDRKSYQIHDGTSDPKDVAVESIGQYIELSDTEKTKIFEGDILQHKYTDRLFNWLIKFKNGSFGLVNIGIDGYLGDWFSVDSTTFTDRKIVGNKTDNSELLKLCTSTL